MVKTTVDTKQPPPAQSKELGATTPRGSTTDLFKLIPSALKKFEGTHVPSFSEVSEALSPGFDDNETDETRCCEYPALRLSLRLTCSMYCVVLMITDVAAWHQQQFAGWWIYYLTNWTQIIVTSFFILGAIKTWYQFRLARVTNSLRLLVFKLRSIALVSSIIVTVNYWFFVRPTLKRISNPWIDLQVHGVACFVVIIDLLMSRRSWIEAGNVYEIVGFFLLFVAWTLIFHVFGLKTYDGKRYLYSIMDWNNPKVVLMLIAGQIFVVIPTIFALAHWVSYCFSKGRFAKTNKEKKQQ